MIVRENSESKHTNLGLPTTSLREGAWRSRSWGERPRMNMQLIMRILSSRMKWLAIVCWALARRIMIS